MINFIIKLEDILKKSGYEDWEIMYLPEKDGYILKLDGDSIFISKYRSDEEAKQNVINAWNRRKENK